MLVLKMLGTMDEDTAAEFDGQPVAIITGDIDSLRTLAKLIWQRVTVGGVQLELPGVK